MRPSAERARRQYDRLAGDYDRGMARAERRLLGPNREWATSRASGEVLELAVGTGLNLPLYGDGVPHVVGVDLSEGMLARARDRIRTPGNRVELRQGDAQALDLADASVDTVLATYALCTVPDPDAVLREARRVLRPAGRLVLVEHGPSRAWWGRLVQRALNPVSIRFAADDLLRDPVALAERAGFTVLEADRAGFTGLVHRVLARR